MNFVADESRGQDAYVQAFIGTYPVESMLPENSEAIIPALMTLNPGSKLGPYEIVGPLGAGGMGEVYRERDIRLGRTW